MLRSSFRRISPAILLVAFFIASAQAVTLKFIGALDLSPRVKNPCPRGDANDVCTLTPYLFSGANQGRNSSAPVFASAWAAFQITHPDWTLIDGGALQGTLKIFQFKPFNDCPDGGGVTVRASFVPAGNDPTQWVWAQGLNDNFDAGVATPHAGPAPPARAEMDGNPSYNVRRDGDFFDRPLGLCVHNSTIYFHAVTLLAQVLPLNKRLIVYEGFEYGWDYTCVHSPVPEPTSIWVFGLGFGALVLRRRRRSIAQRRKIAESAS